MAVGVPLLLFVAHGFLATAQLVTTRTFFGHSQSLYGIAFNPNNDTEFAAGGLDSFVSLWDKVTGARTGLFSAGQVKALAYSTSNSSELLVGTTTAIKVISRTGRLLYNMTLSALNSAEFNPNNESEILSAVTGGAVTLWHKQSGATVATFTGHSSSALATFNPLDTTEVLASWQSPAVLRLFLRTGTLLKEIPLSAYANSIAFNSKNASEILVAHSNNTVVLWNKDTGTPIRLFPLAGAISAAFNPNDDREIAAVGSNNSITIWDKGNASPKCVYTTTNVTTGMIKLAFNPKNGSEILTGSVGPPAVLLQLWAGPCTSGAAVPAPAAPAATVNPPTPVSPAPSPSPGPGRPTIIAIVVGVLAVVAIGAGLLWLRKGGSVSAAAARALTKTQEKSALEAEAEERTRSQVHEQAREALEEGEGIDDDEEAEAEEPTTGLGNDFSTQNSEFLDDGEEPLE